MLGIVGGTGFGEFAGLTEIKSREVETKYGVSYIEHGMLGGAPLLFLPRHGNPPRFPPHMINYRANIDALIASGATSIIAVTAVGGVDESLQVPELIIPDQLIDYTYGRAHTFYDDEIHHIDLTYPYDISLRNHLITAVREAQQSNDDILMRDGGVYGCLQGPRLESAAEMRRLRIDGCDIVGMTAMPEGEDALSKPFQYLTIKIIVPISGMSVKIIL